MPSPRPGSRAPADCAPGKGVPWQRFLAQRVPALILSSARTTAYNAMEVSVVEEYPPEKGFGEESRAFRLKC
jgi:hypothetical protein